MYSYNNKHVETCLNMLLYLIALYFIDMYTIFFKNLYSYTCSPDEEMLTEQNRIFILFKHIQLITITKLQNAWIIKYTYTVYQL